MQKNSIKNTGMLFLAALIWGFAFVAQSAGMEYVGPFTFNAVRCVIGAIVLVPVALLYKPEDGSGNLINSTIVESKDAKQGWFSRNKTLLLGGVSCGIFLGVATNLQQIGIMTTSVGKAGFLTALYIVLVPIAGLFFKKKCPATVWIGVVCSFAGLYLLCMTGGSFSLATGDLLLLGCAVVFTGHILVIDYFAPKVNGVWMSCIQFLTAGIISAILMLFTETPTWEGIFAAKLPILYAGVMSCGVAYTLQIFGQKNYNPTVAVLILSLESCFSVLGGFLILHETLTARELCGCALMFAAIILAQLPGKRSKDE
ncbi:MAG: DMT family transporter [Lachnospiraceae bacterium]|nr:DMT family transporter [Lachnospiraceae bacterium]